jgi:hypothetical protein
MNIYGILFNRIFFRVLPITGLIIFSIIYNEITLNNFLEKFKFWDWAGLILLVVFLYDLVLHLKKAHKRNRSLRQNKLEKVPTEIELPKKLNFLDKRISINENSIDIYLKNELIVHLSKSKKQIEIRKFLGKKILDFNEIQYLFLEYNQYEKDTLKDILSDNSDYDKNVWKNSLMAMLKNGKTINLFNAKLEETNYEQLVEEQISGKYMEKSYLENGKKIVRLFSHYTEKKYLTIDNTI